MAEYIEREHAEWAQKGAKANVFNSSAAHKAGMTYGQYMVANGLVPAVEVKQPTNKYTYNQIRAMAEKNGISHREQAKALGL